MDKNLPKPAPWARTSRTRAYARPDGMPSAQAETSDLHILGEIGMQRFEIIAIAAAAVAFGASVASAIILN